MWYDRPDRSRVQDAALVRRTLILNRFSNSQIKAMLRNLMLVRALSAMRQAMRLREIAGSDGFDSYEPDDAAIAARPLPM